MSENVFVRGESNSNFEALTKEQVLAAIVQAIEGGTISNIDTGFVTTIKEQNKGQGLMFWVGTTAEYEALAEKPNNVLYIKTDDTSAQDISNNFTSISNQITSIKDSLDTKLSGTVLYSGDFSTSGTMIELSYVPNFEFLQVTLGFEFSDIEGQEQNVDAFMTCVDIPFAKMKQLLDDGDNGTTFSYQAIPLVIPSGSSYTVNTNCTLACKYIGWRDSHKDIELDVEGEYAFAKSPTILKVVGYK